MKKVKILFIKKYGANANFILDDKTILSEAFYVKVHNTKTTSDLMIIPGLVSQFIFLLIHVLNSKLIYIWFADYHSYLPVLISKLFFKKSVICAGGYECTYIPEINCGLYNKTSLANRIRYYCAQFSLKYCSLILPVDETLITNTNYYIYSDIEGKKPLVDGIKIFIPDLKTKIETLNLGYDYEYFSPAAGLHKERCVLSAGLIVNEDEYKRKGFDLLVESAKKMPDIKFILAGLNESYLSILGSLKLQNLELVGIVGYDQLIELYRRSFLYAQISMFEGMPSTICEAMLCECVPIGSNVNGIPAIIGGTGVVVYKKSTEEIIAGIRSAFDSQKFSGKESRKRIMEMFSFQSRKEKLLVKIRELVL